MMKLFSQNGNVFFVMLIFLASCGASRKLEQGSVDDTSKKTTKIEESKLEKIATPSLNPNPIEDQQCSDSKISDDEIREFLSEFAVAWKDKNASFLSSHISGSVIIRNIIDNYYNSTIYADQSVVSVEKLTKAMDLSRCYGIDTEMNSQEHPPQITTWMENRVAITINCEIRNAVLVLGWGDNCPRKIVIEKYSYDELKNASWIGKQEPISAVDDIQYDYSISKVILSTSDGTETKTFRSGDLMRIHIEGANEDETEYSIGFVPPQKISIDEIEKTVVSARGDGPWSIETTKNIGSDWESGVWHIVVREYYEDELDAVYAWVPFEVISKETK